MTDREKVISHFRDAIEASGCDNKWRFVRVDILEEAVALLKEQEPKKYEYHIGHTDCIWYTGETNNQCPVTCSQYRDGWNDAMDYVYKDGKGYQPYVRGER